MCSLVLSVPCLRMLCFLFLFPVVSSVLFSLLHCALISLFCVTLFLSANLPTCVISIYFDFSYLYVLWYGWLYDLCGCSFRSRCVCVPFADLYLFKIGIGMRSSLIIVCINSVFPFISFPFSVGLALTGFFNGIFYDFVCRNKESKTF